MSIEKVSKEEEQNIEPVLDEPLTNPSTQQNVEGLLWNEYARASRGVA